MGKDRTKLGSVQARRSGEGAGLLHHTTQPGEANVARRGVGAGRAASGRADLVVQLDEGPLGRSSKVSSEGQPSLRSTVAKRAT